MIRELNIFIQRKDGIIHDKHCDNAKDILDEDLLWSEEYLPEIKLCPDCMIHAYVIAGAKDPKEIETYLGISFERTKMTTEQISQKYLC